MTYTAPAIAPGTECGAAQAGSVLVALHVEHGGRVIWDTVTVTIGP